MWTCRLIALALLASACTGSTTSDRCHEACVRDAECHNERDEEERRYRFDRDECEATCSILERDKSGREQVKRHAECVAKAASCTDVLACP